MKKKVLNINEYGIKDLPLWWIERQTSTIYIKGETKDYLHLECEGGSIYHLKND